jgi:hypothetical protein
MEGRKVAQFLEGVQCPVIDDDGFIKTFAAVYDSVSHSPDGLDILDNPVFLTGEHFQNEIHCLFVCGACVRNLNRIFSRDLVNDGRVFLGHSLDDSSCQGSAFFPPVQ